jgi:Mat/Ecp fimbriae outer membrane usher protein
MGGFAKTVAGAILSALLGVSVPAAAADEAPRRVAAIVVGQPAGFEALSGPQTTVVDVYFGDRRVGETKVTYQPGSLRFENPAAVAKLLPGVADVATVGAALAAPRLDSHAGLVCTANADRTRCGRLVPDVIGAIFDEGRFRVDLFINPRYLHTSFAVHSAYLPAPPGGLSIVDAVTAVMSGSSGRDRRYNVQNRLIVGGETARFRAETSFASSYGFQAERLVAEIDRPGWRFSAGAFWTAGSDLSGRRKLAGVGAETQFDTRLDKDAMRGTPLVVFVNSRSRVDILRDGRVLASRIYEAGNQALDTSGLPDGTYDVVVQITDAGGAKREERRFFSRNRQIAPVGHNIWFAYAGVLIDDKNRKFIKPTGTPFAQIGAAHRIGPRLAIDGTLLATNRAALGEAGLTWLGRQAQVRVAAVAGSNSTWGGVFRIGSTASSRLNFDFDLRHLHTRSLPGREGPGETGPPDLLGPALPNASDRAALRVARSTYSQASATVGYSLGSANLGLSGTYRRERGAGDKYNMGPWVRWEVLRRDRWQLSFDGSYSKSDQGRSGFAGLSLRMLGRSVTAGASTGFRHSAPKNERDQSGPVGGLSAAWHREGIAGADVELSGGYEHEPENNLVNARARVMTQNAEFTGDVAKTIGGNGTLQYSLGFQTTLALHGDRVALVGRNQNESMVMVSVKDAPKNGRFEVLIDDLPSGTVRGGGTLALALTPYRQYDVRIRPKGETLLHYDGNAKRVGLYPGNVARMNWSAKPVVAMFGRLVFADGVPVANATLKSGGGFGQSDDNGWFQIEAAAGARLDVALPDGRSCQVDAPAKRPESGYAALGTVLCNPGFHGAPFNTARLP